MNTELKVINDNNKSKYTFTKDQQNAIDNIINFIAKEFDVSNYIIGLNGAGGTGKTFITKYIIDHCIYSNSVIKCTSPTHKACRVFSEAIGGKSVDTIQSTFGLRLNLKLEDFDPINPQFDPMGTIKLNNIKLLIIDEASMIPAKLVGFICRKCKELKIKLWFIGDEYQLAPVNETKSTAFARCSKLYTLTEVVRQGKENPINKLTNLLRNDIKNKTYNFINYVSQNVGLEDYNDLGEGFSIYNRSNFKDCIDYSFTDKEYTKNINMYRIIGYTNICVAAWNNYIRNTIIKDAYKNIITKNDLIMSYETIVNDFMEIVINNSEEYIINDIVDFIDDKYEFKGFLVKFQLIYGGNITPPLFIIDHRDKYTVMKYYKIINDLINAAKDATGGTRVSRWREYYDFKKKYLLAANILSSTGKTLLDRDIDYGFALTSHRSQGSTYENVFVDLNDMIYNKHGIPYSDIDDLLRRLYVACSRAKHKLILCYGS